MCIFSNFLLLTFSDFILFPDCTRDRFLLRAVCFTKCCTFCLAGLRFFCSIYLQAFCSIVLIIASVLLFIAIVRCIAYILSIILTGISIRLISVILSSCSVLLTIIVLLPVLSISAIRLGIFIACLTVPILVFCIQIILSFSGIRIFCDVLTFSSILVIVQIRISILFTAIVLTGIFVLTVNIVLIVIFILLFTAIILAGISIRLPRIRLFHTGLIHSGIAHFLFVLEVNLLCIWHMASFYTTIGCIICMIPTCLAICRTIGRHSCQSAGCTGCGNILSSHPMETAFIFALLFVGQGLVQAFQLQCLGDIFSFAEPQDQLITFLHTFAYLAHSVIQISQLVGPLFPVIVSFQLLQNADPLLQADILCFVQLILQNIFSGISGCNLYKFLIIFYCLYKLSHFN